jgi:hypothetical protein
MERALYAAAVIIVLGSLAVYLIAGGMLVTRSFG